MCKLFVGRIFAGFAEQTSKRERGRERDGYIKLPIAKG